MATYFTDMTHYSGILDAGAAAPAEVRRLAWYLGRIVEEATSSEAGVMTEAALRCRRRPGRRPCPGPLRFLRSEVPAEIRWECASCDDSGLIRNWRGTPWDRGAGAGARPATPAGPGRRPGESRAGAARAVDAGTGGAGTADGAGSSPPALDVVLTEAEYDALASVTNLDPAGARIVRGARRTPHGVVISGTTAGLDDLVGWIAGEANHTRSRKRQDLLDDVIAAIEGALAWPIAADPDAFEPDAFDPDDDDDFDPDRFDADAGDADGDVAGPFAAGAGDAFAEARALAEQVLGEVLGDDPSASLADVNRALAARLDAVNRAPRQELGGLSAEQVHGLIHGPWEGDGAVVRLDASLPLEALAGSRVLVNARRFLAFLIESDGARATAAGNLSRAAVAELVGRLEWPAGYVEDLHRMNKVVNEEDAFPLHVLRLLLELAGLVRRRKGEFRATRRGRELADDARAGELFALLFHTHFRVLNLDYLASGAAAPGFQSTLGYTLHRFAREGEEWRTPEELAPVVILPAVLEEIPVRPYLDNPAWVLKSRLLGPLEAFGLAEARKTPGQYPGIPKRRYRKAPLFDRFLGFATT